MSVALLAIFVGLQSLLLLLDLRQLRHDRDAQGQPLRWGALSFLLVVTGVFLGVQFAGGWLAPGTLEILDGTRRAAMTLTGAAVGEELSGWTAILFGVALFYFAGFWDYLVHRFFSHSRWFWLTHEYHHLPRQVCVWMPGIFARPFAFLPVTISTLATAATMYALLVCLRLPLWDLRPLLPALLVIALVLTASHSAFLRHYWLVHKVMRCALLTTPHEHLLHHAVESQGNYGNFTTLWDRVFGTYLNPTRVKLSDVHLGLSYDQDFLGTLTLGKLRLSPAMRERYQLHRFCNLHEPQEQP